MHTPSLLSIALLVCPMLIGPNLSAADTRSHTEKSDPSVPWQSDSVLYVAGLSNLKPRSDGVLQITAKSIVFTTKDAQADIPRDRITAVSTGDERVPTGGTAATVVRKIPLYGVGPVVGAVTNKKVDVLTIEYRDSSAGYHGAVFELPKTEEVALVEQQLVASIKVSPQVDAPPCIGSPRSDTVLLAPITTDGVELPAEYRVLLYEQLAEELKKASPDDIIYRAGSTNAGKGCAATTLRLSVSAFKKGNEALRASTGPVGFFVGSTSVNFHVDLVDSHEFVIFEKDLKKSRRGDTESLMLARNVARDVSKRLAKGGPEVSEAPF